MATFKVFSLKDYSRYSTVGDVRRALLPTFPSANSASQIQIYEACNDSPDGKIAEKHLFPDDMEVADLLDASTDGDVLLAARLIVDAPTSQSAPQSTPSAARTDGKTHNIKVTEPVWSLFHSLYFKDLSEFETKGNLSVRHFYASDGSEGYVLTCDTQEHLSQVLELYGHFRTTYIIGVANEVDVEAMATTEIPGMTAGYLSYYDESLHAITVLPDCIDELADAKMPLKVMVGLKKCLVALKAWLNHRSANPTPQSVASNGTPPPCITTPAAAAATAAQYSQHIMDHPTVTLPMKAFVATDVHVRSEDFPQKYKNFKHGQIWKDHTGDASMVVGWSAEEGHILFFCSGMTGPGVYTPDNVLRRFVLMRDADPIERNQFYYIEARGFRRVLLMIDDAAFNRLGFKQGQRVKTNSGAAYVLGFDPNGMLHVHIKGHKGSTVFEDCRTKEDFARAGLTEYTALVPRPVPECPPIYFKYKTRGRNLVKFDVSPKSLAKLGYPCLRHGQLFRDPTGELCMCVGTSDGKPWFHMATAFGAGLFSDKSEAELLQGLLELESDAPWDVPPAGLACYMTADQSRAIVVIDESKNKVKTGLTSGDYLRHKDSKEICLYVGLAQDLASVYLWPGDSKGVVIATMNELQSQYVKIVEFKRPANFNSELARLTRQYPRTAKYLSKAGSVDEFYIDNHVIALFGPFKHGDVRLDSGDDQVLCFGVQGPTLYFHDTSSNGIGKYRDDQEVANMMIAWRMYEEGPADVPDGHAIYITKEKHTILLDIRSETLRRISPELTNGHVVKRNGEECMIAGVASNGELYVHKFDECGVSSSGNSGVAPNGGGGVVPNIGGGSIEEIRALIDALRSQGGQTQGGSGAPPAYEDVTAVQHSSRDPNDVMASVTMPQISFAPSNVSLRQMDIPERCKHMRHGQIFKDLSGMRSMFLGRDQDDDVVFFNEMASGAGIYNKETDYRGFTLIQDCDVPGPKQFYYVKDQGFQRILLTVDDGMFSRLGIKQGQRLETPDGLAYALGFDSTGVLYFHVKGSKGAKTFGEPHSAQDLEGLGIHVRNQSIQRPLVVTGPIYAKYRTKMGEFRTFDISPKAISDLGYPAFRNGDLFKDPDDNFVLAVGVNDGKMFFHVSKSAGAGVFGDVKQEDLLEGVLSVVSYTTVNVPTPGKAFYLTSSADRIVLNIEDSYNKQLCGAVPGDILQRKDTGDMAGLFAGISEDGGAYVWLSDTKGVALVARNPAAFKQGYSVQEQYRKPADFDSKLSRELSRHPRQVSYLTKAGCVESFYVHPAVVALYGPFRNGDLRQDGGGDYVLCTGVRDRIIHFWDSSTLGVGKYGDQEPAHLMAAWRVISKGPVDLKDGFACFMTKDKSCVMLDVRDETLHRIARGYANGCICRKGNDEYMVAGALNGDMWYHKFGDRGVISFGSRTPSNVGMKLLSKEEAAASELQRMMRLVRGENMPSGDDSDEETSPGGNYRQDDPGNKGKCRNQ